VKVKFAELGITDPDVWEEVKTVLESGRFIGGPLLKEFAGKWADICGAKYCVPTASGSAALVQVIKGQRIGQRENVVLVPAYSFAATVLSVMEAGCKPLYVDVLPNGLMDLVQARELCDNVHVDMVLTVHLYGQYLETDAGWIAQSDNPYVSLIEDACQAHGVVDCVQGAAACFSFYPSKNLGAAGDAGAVVTNHKVLNDYVAASINYGDPVGKKYVHTYPGTNARMDAIQAAVLLVKLGQFYEDQAKRDHIAHRYTNGGIRSIATMRPTSWHLYPVLVHNRKVVMDRFREVTIEVGNHYPYVLPDIVDGAVRGDIKNARFLSKHVLTLPIGPHMDDNDADYVIEQFHDLLEPEELDGRLVWRLKDAH